MEIESSWGDRAANAPLRALVAVISGQSLTVRPRIRFVIDLVLCKICLSATGFSQARSLSPPLLSPFVLTLQIVPCPCRGNREKSVFVEIVS